MPVAETTRAPRQPVGPRIGWRMHVNIPNAHPPATVGCRWPLFRDCTYYVLGLLVLSFFAYDQVIELYEAIILFAMYLGYITIMFFNQRLERCV